MVFIANNNINLSGKYTPQDKSWTSAILQKKAEKEPTVVLENLANFLRQDKDGADTNQKMLEEKRIAKDLTDLYEKQNEKNIVNKSHYESGTNETQLNNTDGQRNDEYYTSGLSLFTKEVFPKMRERAKLNKKFYDMPENKDRVGEGDVVSANFKRETIVKAELEHLDLFLQETRESFLNRPDISALSPEEQDNLWSEHKKKVINFLEKFVLNNPETKVFSAGAKEVRVVRAFDDQSGAAYDLLSTVSNNIQQAGELMLTGDFGGAAGSIDAAIADLSKVKEWIGEGAIDYNAAASSKSKIVKSATNVSWDAVYDKLKKVSNILNSLEDISIDAGSKSGLVAEAQKHVDDLLEFASWKSLMNPSMATAKEVRVVKSQYAETAPIDSTPQSEMQMTDTVSTPGNTMVNEIPSSSVETRNQKVQQMIQNHNQQQHQQQQDRGSSQESENGDSNVPKKHSLRYWNHVTEEWKTLQESDDPKELEEAKEKYIDKYYKGSPHKGNAPFSIFDNEHPRKEK